MRLIDADAIIEKISHDLISDGTEDPASPETIIRDDAYMTVGAMIRSTPTVCVTWNEHGQWLHDECETGEGSNTYKCSVCGTVQQLEYGTPEDNEWNYCPHCGAKMEYKRL